MKLATPEDAETEAEPEPETGSGERLAELVAEPEWAADPVGVPEAVEGNARIAVENIGVWERVDELEEQLEELDEQVGRMDAAMSQLAQVVIWLADDPDPEGRDVVEWLDTQSEWDQSEGEGDPFE